MIPSTVHLPNGQTIAVSPVFGGLSFKSNSLNVHHTAFPPGWIIVLQTEDDQISDGRPMSWTEQVGSMPAGSRDSFPSKKPNIHGFKRPTRADDYLFISSISNPSSSDFRPATSPTRQIAMMLWATLYWYFQQPEPDLRLTTDASAKTADKGKPRGDWRIYLRREGVFRGKNLLQKLERMGLISSEDSSVGLCLDERAGGGWQDMFISRRTFWQLDPRIFLFTLSPTQPSPLASGSPYPSRPASPSNSTFPTSIARPESTSMGTVDSTVLATSQGLWAPSTPGPFASTSHLPTYFPPPPLQYTFTNDVRHPIRPKPPRQGETFYTRFIPSVGQYLSFRVASVSSKPLSHVGPSSPIHPTFLPPHSSLLEPHPSSAAATTATSGPSDIDLLHKWMNDPRVAQFWGEDGPVTHQETLLKNGLQSRHTFPVIGCWDGKPFGYMEVYWVREDRLGRYIEGGNIGQWDRGIHVLVGEQEFRGIHRLRTWMSALVHYCFLADYRTENVLLEPRVDNQK
ncbi:MAG: hypothetical protein M1823_003545 [Watsoniomyces obsoletus]|nr:MAG: hypothetical protein M1823_003545 [Watsoniomyces obsoletus]